MVVHIACIAPGIMDHGHVKMLFWVKYPDIKRYLGRYEAFEGKPGAFRYSWDEYFEARRFSSKITKVEGSNMVSATGGKKKKHRRKKHEVEVKEENGEIFNKDTDLWVY